MTGVRLSRIMIPHREHRTITMCATQRPPHSENLDTTYHTTFLILRVCASGGACGAGNAVVQQPRKRGRCCGCGHDNPRRKNRCGPDLVHSRGRGNLRRRHHPPCKIYVLLRPFCTYFLEVDRLSFVTFPFGNRSGTV